MGQRGVFVPIEKSTLVDLYWHQGFSIPEVAEELGVTLRTIHRKMIDHGVPRRNQGGRPADGRVLPPPATVLTARFLREIYQRRLMTIKAIAAETGYSQYTITKYLRRQGVPVRVGSPPIQHHLKRRELAKVCCVGEGAGKAAVWVRVSTTHQEGALAVWRAHRVLWSFWWVQKDD